MKEQSSITILHSSDRKYIYLALMVRSQKNDNDGALLKLVGLSKRLKGQAILSDIDFEQNKGFKVAIAGETGSGKTTLLRIIAGFVQADQGAAYFEGERILGPLDQLMPGTKGIVYLSQQFDLPNNYQVFDVLNYENRLDPAKAEEFFSVCNIEHLLKRKTNELSGGEKQRIALSRLLIAAPKLILLDEPFSNLDPIHKELLKDTINNISRQLKVDCLLVSHDPMDTISWADEIIVLKDGRIKQQGSPNDIFYNPVDEYVAGLFGRFNLVTNSLKKLLAFEGAAKIIRPSQIKLKVTGDHSDALITRIRFLGTTDEIVITLNDTSIIASAVPGKFREGDYVQPSLRKGT